MEHKWHHRQEHTVSPDVKKPSAGWVREWLRLVQRDGVLYCSIEDPGLGQIFQVLVQVLRSELIRTAHDNWGHHGTGRTLGLLKLRCFLPGMHRQVHDYIRCCFTCTVAKAPSPAVPAPMKHLLAFQPLECLSISIAQIIKMMEQEKPIQQRSEKET